MISSAFVFTLLGLVAPAHAQELITAKVPFSFVVGNQTFPAGVYELRAPDSSAAVFTLQGTRNVDVSFVLTRQADGRAPIGNDPALVFVRYENTYRLWQIWQSGDLGHELFGPSAAPKVTRAGEPFDLSQLPTRVVAAKLN
jgi:hypothetical protein